ncbi:hypothetical protein F4782DRAFT_191761 [Xylaria castorea]|nr:hypothetical protein F4782DRAFT_191761 [Xylaria castorea]
MPPTAFTSPAKLLSAKGRLFAPLPLPRTTSLQNGLLGHRSGDGAYVRCRADNGTLQIHRLFTMSSLSRRACYKCGNVGHYAEVCSSAERLCYNCKQPGKLCSRMMHDSARVTNRSPLGEKAMNPTNAPFLERRRLSNATTARGWVMFRPIVQLSG